ncbi:MAG: hypothetical protein JJU18_11950 [Oceanicaulis sp.]|nr:hypothetical protein [Oceanicaulis sp.]
MPIGETKTEARQGVRRKDQERVFKWSLPLAVIALGGVLAIAIIWRPF